MNWGGFAGGFSQGFNNGVNMGKTIGDAIKQKKIEDVRAQGIAEATAMRDKEVADSVKDNGAGAPATEATQPTPANTQTESSATPVETYPVEAPKVESVPAGSYPAAGDPMAAGQPIVAPTAAAPVAASPASPVALQGSPDAPKLTSPMEARAAKKRYSVGDASFDTAEEAHAHAAKSAPSVMDFMGKTLVPRMQEAYIAQGDLEKADAWGKWSKDKKNEKKMEDWGAAFSAAQSGNFEKAAKHVFELYKSYDDGITPLSHETVKDKSGNVTGFNVRLKTDATGEERTQFIDKKTLTEMGLSALSPQAMFEQVYKAKAAADTLSAKAAIDAQNDERTAKRQEAADVRKDARQEAADIRRENRELGRAKVQHGYKLEELTTAEDLKAAGLVKGEEAKVQGKINVLAKNGVSPEAIKELIPHMVGGDSFKKATTQEEARRLLHTERVKDPMYSHKTPVEQAKIIEADMATIYGTTAAAPGSKPVPASPAAAGLPMPKPKGTPYLTPDGKVVYR